MRRKQADSIKSGWSSFPCLIIVCPPQPMPYFTVKTAFWEKEKRKYDGNLIH